MMQRICILTFAERPGKVSTSNLRSLNSFLSIAKSQSVPSRGNISSKNWLLMMTAKPRGLLFILYAACETSHKAIIEYTFISHTHPFNGPLSGTIQVSRNQKGKTNLDFTEARDSEWQRHQLGHMQVCTSIQTDKHASTHRSVLYRTDALPAAQPTASKH